MKGTYFLENRIFETREVPTPEPTGDQVLVRVRACGVCGTDVHIYHGDKGSADVNLPVILGHEIAGEVAAVGSRVTAVKVGDRVALDPNLYCGNCRPCRVGKKQFCTDLAATGVTMDGGFAEYCLAGEKQCFQLKQEIPFRHAALAEPLACCLHGIDRAEIRHGDHVCVIGGGAIGLLMVQLARLAGAARVILSEPVATRREIAREVGADYTIDPTASDPAEQVRTYLGTDGADVVIECVGKPVAALQAVKMAGFGATVVLFSVPEPDTTLPLDLFDVYKKELKVTGSFINPDTQQRAVDLINSGHLLLEPLLTHSYPLEQLEDAIKMQMDSRSIKVLVEP